MNTKQVSSIALSVILVAGTFTLLGAFTFFPIQEAEAQGLQLRVSAAERPQFQNHFFGPQIVQIVIDDPGATDPDESTVGLQVKGVTVPRVHLTDGLWYQFTAEQAAFAIFMDVMTDSVRDDTISVQRPAAAIPFAGSVITIGTTVFTIVGDDPDSFIRELTQVGGITFVEVDQFDIFPTLPDAFLEAAGAPTINPDLEISGKTSTLFPAADPIPPDDEDCAAPPAGLPACDGAGAGVVTALDLGVFGTQNSDDDGLCELGEENTILPGTGIGTDCDWPYIRLTGINELDIVAIRAGSASVNLIFDDFNESIASTIDRTAAYPVNAEVIVSYTDFMANINPVEEDVWSWVLDKETGIPFAVIYNFVRGFDPAGDGRNLPNLLNVLFRPDLNFDTRQVLELDVEGVNTLKFNQKLSIGDPDDPLDDILIVGGDQPTAADSELVEEMDPADEFPVIEMIESDPNTSFLESIDEEKGSRSNIFTGFNDKVANFDYFDIINSAAMTFHDGFATVDREVYDSADRAVFTVTDPDQNLRSRVSEQPAAVESNSFVAVGTPFALANNPTFASVFGDNTINDGGSFDITTPPVICALGDGLCTALEEGATLDRFFSATAPIQYGASSLEIDPDDSAFDDAADIQSEIDSLTLFDTTDVTGISSPFVIPDDEVADGVDPGALGGFRIEHMPPDLSVVALDFNKNGIIERDGDADDGEIIIVALEVSDVDGPDPDLSDVLDAIPFDSARSGETQKAALDFRIDGVPADEDEDSKASTIIINTDVTLEDLNQFQAFTATEAQIVRNGFAGFIDTPEGVTEGVDLAFGTIDGTAFDIDPYVGGTALFTDGVTVFEKGDLDEDSDFVLDVFVPEYNLFRANLQLLQTGTEPFTGDRLLRTAIQLEAVCPSDLCEESPGKVVRQIVDFTPFGTTTEGFLDVDPTLPGGVTTLLPPTKIGTGGFRVVDFLTADWDDSGTPWPVDASEATTHFPFIEIRVTVVTISNNSEAIDHVNEPSEVIDVTSHVGALDIIGLVEVIPPPILLDADGDAVAGTLLQAEADRTIDEIELIAVEHIMYRIQVKEQGSNSSIFTGRLDFQTTNQFDTTQIGVINIVFEGDPAKALMTNRFIPPDRLAFSYTDIDIVEVFRDTSASFIYETRDGSIEWDRASYSFGQDAFVTLVDEDLNRRPDATERFDVPIAGFVFLELGKKRVLDETIAGVEPSFIGQVDATFLETGPNTGTFVAQISMFPTITVSTTPGPDEIQGTADDTAAAEVVQQQDLEINYIDIRDRSSIRQEFDDITNIRTTLGDVVLDRAAYPPGAIMFIEIHDNDFNQDVDIRERIDLRQIVITLDVDNDWGDLAEGTRLSDFGTALADDVIPAACGTFALLITADCANGAPILEINVFQTGVGRLFSLLPGGLLDVPASGGDCLFVAGDTAADRFGDGISVDAPTDPCNILPILDRNGNLVTEGFETGPNTGIFEFESQMPGPAEDDRFPFDLPDVLTSGTVENPVIVTNLPIQVTYFDPSDESGDAEDEEELATFLTNTARLSTDALEYGLGDRVEIIIEEPDFNVDSRAVDEVKFTVLDIVTDKFDTEFGPDPEQDFGDVINEVSNLRTNLTNFRETDFNSGVFTVAIEELVQELVDRGEVVRLLFFDPTPSGGGTEIRVQYVFLVVAILPEIVFDKEEYTPFDEIIVSIISPDSNTDPDQIERITPLVSSSSDSLGRERFSETGPNTGIFEEDFDLTPDRDRFPGDLRAIREDGVTVEFRIDSDTVATKSVFVNYHVGQVMFDKDAFSITERGVMRVIDPDENNNPDTIDTLEVRFWSTTDRGGLLVVLRETGDRTGIFEEIITFTPDEESTGTRLRVTEGDTITAKYTDNTLPAPAALDADEVFTVEIEELFASALIGALVPPLERAVASEPELVDQTGATLTDVGVGTQVLIQSTITNSQTKKQPFAFISQIKDSNGVTIFLSWITGELPAQDSLQAAQSWIPDAAGEYTVEIFVWADVDTPTALSPVRTITVTVS